MQMKKRDPKDLYFHAVYMCMSLNFIPRIRDDVQISRVNTLEGLHFVLYISSHGRKITPNAPPRELLVLCDGTHTLKEISSHFAKVSNESPSTIEGQLERILERLIQSEAIQLCEDITPRDIPPEVELSYPLEEVVMEVTTACNLKCVHYYIDAGQKREGELTSEEIFCTIDEVKRLGALFFEKGGYIRDSALGLELFTNGVLVTRAVAKNLKDLNVLTVSV